MFFALKRSYVGFLLVLCSVTLFLLPYHAVVSTWRRSDWDLPRFGNGEVYKSSDSLWSQIPITNVVEDLRQLPQNQGRGFSRVQYDFGRETPTRKQVLNARRKEIKEQTMKGWQALQARLSNPDAMGTLVGSLDTLWIMSLEKEFRASVDKIVGINFDDPPQDNTTEVNVAKITNRFVGGLLSAFDLSGDSRLLRKAVEIGEMLLVAFDTPNRLPSLRWRPLDALNRVPQQAEVASHISELGGLSLEFTHLSQLLDDSRWFDAVQRITEVFAEQQHTTALPGLWPVLMNTRECNFDLVKLFTLGTGAEVFYEYLPKQFALLRGNGTLQRRMYQSATAVVVENLLYRPMVPDEADILFSGTYEVDIVPAQLNTKVQHVSCSVGSMFALGGRLFNITQHIEIGAKISDACVWAYHQTPHGIMPEAFTLLPCRNKTRCKWNESRYRYQVALLNIEDDEDPEFTVPEIIKSRRLPHGFTSVTQKQYTLRPEAIESMFVLYRITGDIRYQEMAWEMWQAIQAATQTGLGNTALADVMTDDVPLQVDSSEGFWLTETLKYFYLIFSEPDLISLDDWVLNAEAHPFKLQ